MIVVDASVLANAIGDDEAAGRTARTELRAAVEFTAPDLVDVETVALLRQRWLAGTISADHFAAAVDDLHEMDFERVPTARMIRRAFQLRANVTSYDATYVALAETLDCVLLTGDNRLAAATGPRCTIRALS